MPEYLITYISTKPQTKRIEADDTFEAMQKLSQHLHLEDNEEDRDWDLTLIDIEED